MIQRRTLLAASAAATTSLLSPWASAQAPAATLETQRVLCGFPAGGTTDAVSRRVAEKLRGQFAKQTLVENKPGAGGRLAVEELRRSPPDGSSLLLTPAGMITLYPHIYTKLSYTTADVTPVSTGGVVAFALAVSTAVVPDSVKTIKDYLAWVKANPNQASYGSPGAGSPPHFLGALLAKESGVTLSHIPYRGSAPGVQDLLGGQLPAMSSPIGDYLPHLKSGKVRVLATSGAQRSRFLPDVPTYTEQGFKALEMTEWYGFFLPAKAAPDLTDRMAKAIRAAVTSPEVVEGLAALGVETQACTPAEMLKMVKDETARWQGIVKHVGFVPEA